MAADNEVDIFIRVDSKDAKVNLLDFQNFSKKSLGKVEDEINKATKGVQSFGDSFKGLKSGLSSFALPITAAIGSIIGAFNAASASIQEAVDDARELKQIRAALLATGEASDSAVEDIVSFANAVRDATTIDDGFVRQLFISAKAFGITNEEAKKLTQAALDLSAATGRDAESSLQQLGKTLDGSVGKIGDLGDEFRNLTEEQNKAFGAIDLVSKNFGGSAQRNAEGYEGSVNKLANAFRDLKTSFGQTITESDLVEDSFVSLSNVFTGLSNKIDEFNKKGIETRTGGFTPGIDRNIDRAAQELVNKKLEQDTRILDNLVENLQAQERAADSAEGFFAKLQKEAPKAAKALALINKETQKSAEDFKKSQQEADKFIAGLVLNSGTEIEVAAKKAADEIAKLNGFVQSGIKVESEVASARLSIIEGFNERVGKLNDERAKEDQDRIRRQIEDEERLANEREKIISLAGTAAQAVVAGGDERAQKRNVGSVITAGASAIPGIGPVLGQVASLATSIAALTKEEAKEFAKGFAEAIPEFVIALVENIPEIVEGFIEVLSDPKFWQRVALAFARATVFALTGPFIKVLSDALQRVGPEIVSKISTGFNDFFSRLGPALSQAFDQIGPRFLDALRGLATIIRDAITGALKPAFDPLIKALQPLTDALNSLKGAVESAGSLGGRGGGRGVLVETGERIGSALGFASGGLVPAYAASGMFVPRGTDTVPAMLTPGELVVPTDLVSQLAGFLANQNTGSGGGSDTAILAAILQAVQQPMTVKAEAKVNQSAFADIILQLNRQNARLSA